MEKLGFRLATWGAALGMLVGVVELSIGVHIRPWIGNKENSFILGWMTLLLNGLAWITARIARRHVPHTADGKLATILGMLVPAGVCFTSRREALVPARNPPRGKLEKIEVKKVWKNQ